MIDFDKYYSLVFQFLSNNIFIALGLIVVLVVLIYKKPEGTIKFLGFCCFLLAVIYTMSLLGESGSLGTKSKKTMTSRSEDVINQSPK